MRNRNFKDCGTGMQRLSIAVACALVSACTHEATLSQPAPAAAVAPATEAAAAPSSVAPVAAVAAPAASAPVAAAPAPVAPEVTPAAPAVPAATAAPAPKAATAPARVPPAAKPAPAAVAAPAVAAAAAAPAPAAAALDLPLLEQRLKDTRAIGVFTKLSLKNQVDDLLKQFRAFHKGGSGKTLPQLRQSYEVLLLKVVSLLQDDDPTLAAAVGSSREAIWGVLVDPKKFASLDA